MRIAILTDVHANALALEAVLRDVRQHHPDQIVFGGDLAVNGPRPAETLDQVIALSALAVRGNMDDEALHSHDPVSEWARARLSASQRAFLAGLPLQQRISPSGGRSTARDLLIVHSTPRSNNDLLILELASQTTSFKQRTPEEEALPMLAGATADHIVYGHIHYFSTGKVGTQRVSSIGSVGFPFDGDQRAAYALADWDGSSWTLQPVRVPYPYERAAHDIETSGQPLPGRYAAMLRRACWLPKPD